MCHATADLSHFATQTYSHTVTDKCNTVSLVNQSVHRVQCRSEHCRTTVPPPHSTDRFFATSYWLAVFDSVSSVGSFIKGRPRIVCVSVRSRPSSASGRGARVRLPRHSTQLQSLSLVISSRLIDPFRCSRCKHLPFATLLHICHILVIQILVVDFYYSRFTHRIQPCILCLS